MELIMILCILFISILLIWEFSKLVLIKTIETIGPSPAVISPLPAVISPLGPGDTHATVSQIHHNLGIEIRQIIEDGNVPHETTTDLYSALVVLLPKIEDLTKKQKAGDDQAIAMLHDHLKGVNTLSDKHNEQNEINKEMADDLTDESTYSEATVVSSSLAIESVLMGMD